MEHLEKNVLWIRTPEEDVDYFVSLYYEIVVLTNMAHALQLGIRS